MNSKWLLTGTGLVICCLILAAATGWFAGEQSSLPTLSKFRNSTSEFLSKPSPSLHISEVGKATTRSSTVKHIDKISATGALTASAIIAPKANEALRAVKDLELQGLLERLGVSIPDKQRVGDLFSNYDQQVKELRFGASKAGVSATLEAIPKIKRLDAEFKQELTDVIGAENASSVLLWNASGLDRARLSRLQESLSKSNVNVTDNQSQALLNALYQARKGDGPNLPVHMLGNRYVNSVIANLGQDFDENQLKVIAGALSADIQKIGGRIDYLKPTASSQKK